MAKKLDTILRSIIKETHPDDFSEHHYIHYIADLTHDTLDDIKDKINSHVKLMDKMKGTPRYDAHVGHLGAALNDLEALHDRLTALHDRTKQSMQKTGEI